MTAASTPPIPSKEVIERLRHASLFQGFTDTGLQIIASVAVQRSFADGALIVEEGQFEEKLYVLCAGRVQVVVQQASGEVPVGVLEAPTSFGEAALIHGGPRQCSIRADGSVEVLEMSRTAVAQLQRSKPQACLKLMMAVVEAVGERLRAAEPELKQMLTDGLGS